MKKRLFISCSIICLLIDFGCSTTYVYRVVNDGCNCDEYHTSDHKNKVDYFFHARYRMSDGILTTIEVEFTNHSNDSLSLGLGTVKISSRNISYQYNDKFLPLPPLTIAPHNTDMIQLTGKSLETAENWYKIAGEQLTLTLKGLRLGSTSLPPTTIVFIPENPKLKR